MTPALPPSTRRRQALRLGGAAAVALVLAGVFMLYTRPAFFVTMIDQVWGCF